MASRTGQCLCGAVRFRAELPKAEMSICHCDFCRRWTAGPFMTVDGASEVAFEGDDPAIYQSSEWGERGFCRTCGTSLFWRSRDGAHCAFSAYVLNDAGPLELTTEIFIDRKPDDYAFANETRKMTGDEVFAAFAPSGTDANG